MLGSSMRGTVTCSPIDGKIQLIANQIHSMEVPTGRASAKARDLDKLEEKSKKIEARLKECDELHQKRLSLLTETLSKFTKVLEEERGSSESLYEDQMKRITRLEDKMTDLVSSIEKVMTA